MFVEFLMVEIIYLGKGAVRWTGSSYLIISVHIVTVKDFKIKKYDDTITIPFSWV